MIQRIQSLYLLVITVLMIVMMFLPLAGIQHGETYGRVDVFGLTTQDGNLVPMWGMFVMTAIISILSVMTIFMYSKRMLQIRLCIFNGIMMGCFYALFAFCVYLVRQEGDAVNLRIALSFPVICMVLDYLAVRNIGADEVLVRSLDRLR